MMMETTRNVRLRNRQARVIHWLEQVTSDYRDETRCIYTQKNGTTFATDGFRFHAARYAPDFLKPGTVMVSFADNNILHVTKCNQPLLNYEAALPKGKPIFQITVNANLLREALSVFDSPVTLYFYGEEKVIEIIRGGYYALVMPMNILEQDPNLWKPIPEKSNSTPPVSHEDATRWDQWSKQASECQE